MAEDDGAGLTDEVQVFVNGEPHGVAVPLPDRPGKGVGKDVWVDYVVALGADRAFVTGGNRRFDTESGDLVTDPSLTKDELIALADRLGG
jgi:hypothetical protein